MKLTSVFNRLGRGAALFWVAAVAWLACPAASRADKAPEPSVYPVSWELKFTHGVPKRVLVDVVGRNHAVAYWYLAYTVTNAADQAIEFVPDFRMLSDEGKVTKSDRAVPHQVYEAIAKREGNKLMMPARKVEGPLNPGEDQAKDSVAIWPEPTVRMGSFSIFCGGLSGEFVKMKDKDGNVLTEKDPTTNEEEPVILRKTLQLMFHMVGEDVATGEDDAHPKAEQWVMR